MQNDRNENARNENARNENARDARDESRVSKDEYIGEADTTPDSTQVPWNAEAGKPDERTLKDGEPGARTSSDRSDAERRDRNA